MTEWTLEVVTSDKIALVENLVQAIDEVKYKAEMWRLFDTSVRWNFHNQMPYSRISWSSNNQKSIEWSLRKKIDILSSGKRFIKHEWDKNPWKMTLEQEGQWKW